MANLSIGIVGLPNVGKSLLFKTLTKQEVNVANYPFATIDPNVGIVVVPDERVDKLADLMKSAKKIPAVVEFYDIAGLVKGANKGEGLGNQFLSHIRDANAIVQVVRCFENSEIIHVENKIDPSRDIDTINTELILKDLETIGKRLAKLEAEARSGDKNKIKELEIVKKIHAGLNENKLAINIGVEISPEINLLTSKPQIYLLNGKPEDVTEGLKDKIAKLKADYLIIDLANAENINDLIKKAYELLGLISFLTTGEDETRAWTIKKGTKAPQAAGVIHTDFEKKFIRAEVINWNRLLEIGSWSQAKAKGWMRLEGKNYVVQDGDVIEVRHG